MPNYYNPYNFYPVTYQNPTGYSAAPQPTQQSFTNGPSPKVMEWVEGEVGAKAFQMPQGWPANQPIPLWDSTDTNIYLKSWSPMGFPNPLQKLHYTMPEQNAVMLPQGQSGDHDPAQSQYATKEDLEQMRNEIKTMLAGQNNQNNQNGSNSNGNRGVNR